MRTIYKAMLIVISLLLLVSSASAWWDSDWDYRKTFVLSNTGDALTNYQYTFTVFSGSGYSSGSTVYLDGNGKADYSDVRFISSDDTTQYDIWIEHYNATLAYIVVEIQSIPSGASYGYLYYGNNAATGVSSGTDTFIKFSDCSDMSGFDFYSAKNYTITSNNLDHNTTDLGNAMFNTPIQNYTIEARLMTGGNGLQYTGLAARRGLNDADVNDVILFTFHMTTATHPTYDLWFGPDWVPIGSGGSYTDIQLNTWYSFKMSLYGANIYCYADAVETHATTLRISVSNASVLSGAGAGVCSSILDSQFYDDIRIRQYTPIEPTVFSWGASSTPTPTPSTAPEYRTRATATIATLNVTRYDDFLGSLDGVEPDFGDAINALFGTYTDTAGSIAIIILLAIPFIMMWLMQGRVVVPATVGIILSYIIGVYMPVEYKPVTTIFIVLYIISIVWAILRDR